MDIFHAMGKFLSFTLPAKQLYDCILFRNINKGLAKLKRYDFKTPLQAATKKFALN